MRNILSLLAALAIVPFAAAAHADFVSSSDTGKKVSAMLMPAQVQFSYFNQNSLNSCDYVQGMTTEMLQAMGARNVKVQCTGGIPYDNGNFVTATFTTVHEAGTAKSTLLGVVSDVSLSASESCDLHRTIYMNVVKSFQVYAQNENDSCWNSEGRFEAHLQVLK